MERLGRGTRTYKGGNLPFIYTERVIRFPKPVLNNFLLAWLYNNKHSSHLNSIGKLRLGAEYLSWILPNNSNNNNSNSSGNPIYQLKKQICAVGFSRLLLMTTDKSWSQQKPCRQGETGHHHRHQAGHTAPITPWNHHETRDRWYIIQAKAK